MNPIINKIPGQRSQVSGHIHFIGIGGIGMSAIARILKSQGEIITGSDSEPSKLTEELREEGIEVFYNHNKNNISKDTQLVVYTAAVLENNPELKEAKKRKIPCVTYSESLGQISKEHFTIAITGSHGKSTITSMLGFAMNKLKLDPTVLVGTLIPQLNNKNTIIGKSKYFVCEACEYKRTFLNLHPTAVLINNIDPDHFDYFKDEKDYQRAYIELMEKIPQNGFVIANYDDKLTKEACQKLKNKKIIYFSHKNKNIPYYLDQENNFYINKQKKGKLKLKIFGAHNYQNALAVLTLLDQLNIDVKKAMKFIQEFTGSWRRFEYKGKINNAKIFDDYGHHPTEIKATLRAAKEQFPNKKIIVCFQPHQYNRTRNLLKEFATSFTDADSVIIPNIYKVRDNQEDQKAVTTQILVNEISKHHKNVKNGRGFKNTAKILKETLNKDHMCLIMGAGDVFKITEMLEPD
ncbi:MAG: UDP-N-acetylmuramate-L-alanine ligase [Candidatus Peregrinibacteria bacterium GW2011_GWA2_33_10]|nr:MAG: UDP-N-acetylmuramate-L-alanine ligase [Candidatus Peregrinibacteria bacterium GW2011_GWA2_33_10]KKP41188.1 MAG: UDP-N-acetylmuramate-L-alanine ligase, UDP-N-acetylmuramate-alanine ligase [Candidatus Peregrinibacteria bacterium GW2011_GWC2_33_13]